MFIFRLGEGGGTPFVSLPRGVGLRVPFQMDDCNMMSNFHLVERSC